MNQEQIMKDFITIFFSKDRPMQLDLALTTNQKNSLEWEDQKEYVLYAASDERYLNAYTRLSKEHSSVSFLKQTNFREDLLFLLKNKKYVMFVVDDSIFTRQYSPVEIIANLISNPSYLGFSLRLGKNTTNCYPICQKNEMPDFEKFGYSMEIFNWKTAGTGDFSYPLELSSSLYKLHYLNPLLYNCEYHSPNSLEATLAANAHLFSNSPFLLCYETSVAFSNPVNRVQNENVNRVGTNLKYSLESLLKRFEKGEVVNSSLFEGFVPNGAHQEVSLEFLSNGVKKVK